MKRPHKNGDEDDFEEYDGYISPVEEVKRESKKEREERILRERIEYGDKRAKRERDMQDLLRYPMGHLNPDGTSMVPIYDEINDPHFDEDEKLKLIYLRALPDDQSFRDELMKKIRENRYKVFGVPKEVLDQFSGDILSPSENIEFYRLLNTHLFTKTKYRTLFYNTTSMVASSVIGQVRYNKVSMVCIWLRVEPHLLFPEYYPPLSRHATIMYYIPTKNLISFYDSSKIIASKDDLLKAIRLSNLIETDTKEFLTNILNECQVNIYQPSRQFDEMFHNDSCGTFALWNSLWLALNPRKVFEKQENPPLIIGYDVVGFRQFVRYCLARGKIKLSGKMGEWRNYIGGKKITWKKI